MNWKKVPEGLTALLEEAMRPYGAVRKSMFGCPVFFVNGYMMAGAHQDNVILRLSPEDRERLFSEYDEAAPFEPMEGRVMKDYAAVPESLAADSGFLDEWLSLAHRHALSLPPKAPKPKKQRAKKPAGR